MSSARIPAILPAVGMRLMGLVLALAALSSPAAALDWNPANDPAYQWDYADQAWFHLHGYPNPWNRNTRFGIRDLGTANPYDLKRDWELYMRNLTPEDEIILLAKASAAVDPVPPPGQKFFCLYNRKLGIMRMFFYLKPIASPDGKFLSMKIAMASRSGAMATDHAYLNYDSKDVSFPVSSMTTAAEKKIEHVIQHNVVEMWLVTDTYLAFDPAYARPANKALYLNYEGYSLEESQIKLAGDSKPNAAEETDGGATSMVSSIRQVASVTGALGKSATDIYDGIEKMEKWATKDERKDKGWAKEIVSVCKTAGTFAGPVGPVLGFATGIMGLFTSSGGEGGAQTNITFPNYVMNLSGTIQGARNNAYFDLPIASAIYDVVPYYAKVHNQHVSERALGLFNLGAHPKLTVYCIPQTRNRQEGYLFSVSADMGPLHVNPVTGARLVDVQIMPAFNVQVPPAPSQKLHRFWSSGPGFSKVTGRYWMQMDNRIRPVVTPDLFKVYLRFDVGGGQTVEIVKSYWASLKVVYGPKPPGDDPVTPLPDNLRDAVYASTSATRNGFITDGPANWYGTGWRGPNEAEIPGGTYIASPTLRDGEKAAIETKITGSRVSFDVKTDTEYYYDGLVLYVDGNYHDSFSGSTNWNHVDIPLASAGVHTLRFEYSKDVSLSVGADKVWLDNLIVHAN